MRIRFVSLFILAGGLSACTSGSGDWPNLSDPLPREADRNVALEPAMMPDVTPGVKPVVPSRPGMTGEISATPDTDVAPATEQEATALLESIKKTLREETLAYRQAKARIAESADEARQDAWFQAQLALTRLSQTANRLDGLMVLDMATLADAAASEADIIERFVVGERQQLFDAKPAAQN